MNWVICGSGNDLSLVGRKLIILTSADILPIWPLGTIFSENLIKIQTFSVKKMQLKVLSANYMNPGYFTLVVIDLKP